MQAHELRQFQWHPHFCACNTFTNGGSKQEDEGPAVLALGILKEIPKQNSKQKSISCIITTIFQLSLKRVLSAKVLSDTAKILPGTFQEIYPCHGNH